MVTYYGFQKGEKFEPVNWSEIGKAYSDTVQNVIKDRQRRKKEIDDKLAADLEYIENNPQGQHKGVSDGVAQLAQDLRAQTLELERQLKSGQLSLRDYTLQRQNMMDDTERVFKAAQELQKNFATINERTQNGENQTLESEAWDEYGGLINFDTHSLYIDPNTGRILMGELDENGVINPYTLNSVETILNGMNQRYDSFDDLGWLESQTKYIDQFKSYTPQMLIDDPRIMKEDWPVVKESAIAEAMANDYNTSSILTGSLPPVEYIDPETGEKSFLQYRSTTDREEFEADKIENGGTGTLFFREYNANNSGIMDLEFQDSQIEAVEEWLGSKMEMAVGFDKKPRKTTTSKGTGGGLSGEDLIVQIDRFAAGDVSDAGLAETVLRENYNEFVDKSKKDKKKIDKIARTSTGYTVTFIDKDGAKTTQSVSIDEDSTQEQRVEALYKLLQPSQTDEDSWQNAFPSFNRNNKLTSDIEGVEDYSGTLLRQQIEAKPFDKLITLEVEDGKTIAQTVAKDVNNKGVKGVEKQQMVLSNFLTEALRSSKADVSLLDISSQIDEDGNVTVFDGETEIGSFKWPTKGWPQRGKRTLEKVEPQLQEVYKKVVEYYNNKVGSGARSTETTQAPGDAIFSTPTQATEQVAEEVVEEAPAEPLTVEEQFRENVNKVKIGRASEDQQQIVLGLFEQYPDIFEGDRLSFNEFRETLGEEYESPKWSAYTRLFKNMQDAIASSLNQ